MTTRTPAAYSPADRDALLARLDETELHIEAAREAVNGTPQDRNAVGWLMRKDLELLVPLFRALIEAPATATDTDSEGHRHLRQVA